MSNFKKTLLEEKDGVHIHLYDLFWVKSSFLASSLKLNLPHTILFIKQYPVR